MTEKINELITVAEPRSAISEAYRTLRTNLDFASLDQALKTLVITSAGVGEGKSTTLANLAVVSAQAGRRVILVDADLRRPTLHQILGAKNDTGLTSMVVDEARLTAPPLQETGIPGLSLLSSGPLPPNPAELLGSRRMAEVIAALAEEAEECRPDECVEPLLRRRVAPDDRERHVGPATTQVRPDGVHEPPHGLGDLGPCHSDADGGIAAQTLT